jgi:hypothetical protein
MIMTEQEISDYRNDMIQENEKRQRNIKETLDIIKNLVENKYYIAITEWLADKENGIWGNLEVVTKPKGEWQEEGDFGYWDQLKGMYVDQYVGYCGDDYSGFISVRLPNNNYLQACFQL